MWRQELLEEISVSEALWKGMKDRGKGTVIAGKGQTPWNGFGISFYSPLPRTAYEKEGNLEF